MSADVAQLLIPIGFPLGPFHVASGEPAAYEVVRVGWESKRLESLDARQVWLLAHGSWSKNPSNWTRDDLLRAAREDGVGNPESVLDELIDAGLVAAFDPDGSEAKQFVRDYRVAPLMVGYGQPIEPADAKPLLGLMNWDIKVPVDRDVFDFWKWAHSAPHLARAAQTLIDRPESVTGKAYQTADHLLVDFFRMLQILIARGAMYVDVRWTPRPDYASTNGAGTND